MIVEPLDQRCWDIFAVEGIAIEESDVATLQNEFLLEFDKSEAFVSSLHDQDGEGQ